MKTENINNNACMNGKRDYIKPHADIINMGTSYGMMSGLSIAEDPNTPATGDGNAKKFDISDDMWGEGHE